MLIQQVILQDFGVYGGRVSLDLSPKEKPIVILGGKNGSGKTTLLEAVKLCLYGSKVLGRKVSRREYDNYVRSRVHHRRRAIIPLDYTSVSISFEYSKQGETHVYEIIRSWKVKPDSVQENLYISIDGTSLSTVEEKYWQDFIDDLIPPSIFDLFFFDGEKVQSLIIDGFHEHTLADEVKRLLGLNTIERLLKDLDTYQYKLRKENAVSEIQTYLNECEEQHKIADQKHQLKLYEIGQIHNEVENTKGQIEKLEANINRESSGFAFNRDNLRKQLSQIESEIEILEKQLQEMAGGLLPFTLIPELYADLRQQLCAEAEATRLKASHEIFKPRVVELQKTISERDFWSNLNGSLSAEARAEMTREIISLLDRLLDSSVEERGILHDVSELERARLISWIDHDIKEIPEKVEGIEGRLNYLERTKQDLEEKLRKVPGDEVLKPLFLELQRHNQKLGELNATLIQLDQERNSLHYAREEAFRQVKKAFEELRFGKMVEERIRLADRTKQALEEFLLETTLKRMIELENLIVYKFNELSYKPDLIVRVKIDPQSFSIQLFGQEDNLVSKDLLSAGEKQLFAIALLWALRELSEKPFPVMIDTPLGRLDSDHRNHLVRKYFPRVSHQVILFSTDTEIDRTYFDALEPYTSHSFCLDYDPATGSTNIKPGYFWDRSQYAA